MYEAFYKLGSDPFRLLPDPDICFPHRSCAKAWAYLRYALKRGEGIVVVTGPPGSGKTTLAERLLNELNPAQTVSVRLIANNLNPTDLLRKLAYSFGLPAEGMDRAMLAHRIERYLIELEHNRRQALVLIDEAQTLSHQALEAMRLLTDLQSRSKPVLQLFLLGQEELEGVMCAPGMEQFQQRVIASSRLDRMNLAETKAYLEYRLGFADWCGDPSINGPAVIAIYRFSRGLPRHVNKICSRLLLHGCTEEKHALKQRDVLAVVQDLRHELLVPNDDEPEVAVDLAGSSFDAIDELALVPSSRQPVAARQTSHAELNALFLADDPSPDSDPGADHPRQRDSVGRMHGQRAGGRHYYRVGYPRPFRFRRKVYGLFQIPRVLFSHGRDLAHTAAPVVGGFLARLGRTAMQQSARVRELLPRWNSESPMLDTLRERARALPRSSIAGLAGLIVIGLAMLLWNHDGDSQRELAAGESADYRRSLMPYGPEGQEQERPAVLGESSRYMDVAELPVGEGDYVSSVLGSERTLRQGMVEADVSDYRGIMQGDPEQLLLGTVTGEAADFLIGRMAQVTNTWDVWSLANKTQSAAARERRDAKAAIASMDHDGASTWASASALENRRTPREGGTAPSAENAGWDDSLALIVMDESGMPLDFVHFLPATAAGRKSGKVSEDAGPIEVEAHVAVPETAEAVSMPAENMAGAGVPESVSSAALVQTSGQDTESADSGMVGLQVSDVPGPDQPVPDVVAEEQAEIQRLLGLAAEAMERDRLLKPYDRSAYSYLKKVLAIDAENRAAHSGLDRVVSRYRDLAKGALDDQQFDKAGRFIERGLRVDPDNAGVLALRDDLNSAITEAEAAELAAAELARIAMEPPKPEPVVVPEKRTESNFSSLMRFVDGLTSVIEN